MSEKVQALIEEIKTLTVAPQGVMVWRRSARRAGDRLPRRGRILQNEKQELLNRLE